ncbi:MAG: hypothetical protein AAF716_15415 [Cyanobacteria bacterium P01_D01_bin.1]
MLLASATLLLTLSLGGGAVTAQTIESNAPSSLRGFFKRIFRDDEWEDPPTISRGELCLLTPARPGQEIIVWHQNPVFVWRGEIARMEVVDGVTDAVVWEYEPSPEQISVAYAGETLRAGRSYLWRVYDDIESTSPTIFPPFAVMSSIRRQLIANGLAVAESKVEADSAIARTEYFALRGMPTDALQSLFLIESPNEELIEARRETVDRLCE